MPNNDTVVIPPFFDETTIATFCVSVFLPLLIAFLKSHRTTAKFAAWWAFGVCLVTALLITFLGKAFFGEWSNEAMENVRLVTMNIVAVLIGAWNFYSRLWSPIGLTDKLETIGPQVGDTAR